MEEYFTKPFYQRDLADGREICVFARIYNAILTIGPKGEDWYEMHYCYENPVQAKLAAEAWDPAKEKEPSGWFRHSQSGRRRPNGDASKEFIRR